MNQVSPHKSEIQGTLDKLIHMYLPSSGQTKFSNRLLITKMSSPRAMNIQFNQNTIPVCLHSRQKFEQKHKKNRKQTFRISLNEKNRAIVFAQGPLSDRYQKKETIEDKNMFMSTRDEHLKTNREKDLLERWKSLHVHKQGDNKNNINKDVQKQVRISISRMLQQSTNKQSFQYITKFYKKPIERQIAVKKVKRQSKSISEVLNVTQYKPHHNQFKKRFFKTIEPRCRCHKNSHSVDMKRINNTSYLAKRTKLEQNEQLQKPKTSITGTRKILTLSIPQNWTVDSWNPQQKSYVNDQGLFHD